MAVKLFQGHELYARETLATEAGATHRARGCRCFPHLLATSDGSAGCPLFTVSEYYNRGSLQAVMRWAGAGRGRGRRWRG